MGLKKPPELSVLKALAAIADDRVDIVGSHGARVQSSEGEEYEVLFDSSENKVRSSDPMTLDGYIGYPVISLLMLQGILPYDAFLASKLRGVEWERLEDKFKDPSVVAREVLRKWRVPDRRKLQRFVQWTLDMISETTLEKMERKTTLQDFA